MKWLYKLEYKHGRHYIRNLMTIITAGMVAVLLVSLMLRVDILNYMRLDRDAILSGQVWRLVSFIFVPEGVSLFWIVITIYLYWSLGTHLERVWGGFRFNLFYLFGIIGAWLAMFITGYAFNTYINLSIFLAYAILEPDSIFRIMFIFPVKAKWLAIFDAILIAISLVNAFTVSISYGLISLVSFAFSLAGFLLFFGQTLIHMVRDQIRIARNRRNWRR